MPRALQISGMAVPLASSASASRSLRMICSGEWRMRFMVSPSDLKGENDSHTRWTSPAGAGHTYDPSWTPGDPGAIGTFDHCRVTPMAVERTGYRGGVELGY